MNAGKLVTRNKKVAFMNVSTTGVANFLRMTKFTEISKSKNPTEYSRTYVDEDGEVTDVTGYSEEISYAFDLHTGNLVHQKIVDITDNEKVGNDALVQILQVDFTKQVGEGYEARLRTYSVVPDTEGDSTDAYTYSGSFKKNNNMTIGVATMNADNTVATFTASEEVAEFPVNFLVTDASDNMIDNAKITIDGTSYVTDATGLVTVFLDAKAYNGIKVEKDGYTTQNDVAVTVADKAVLKEIELAAAE
ncbi:MAG: hypothetical protein U0I39_06645 [Clostridia bacterium]|jgi:hypothetical protein|nr:hypothetical protein [Clostridia bacterium]DAQ69757.1 MAG TPA: putative transglutaminase-family protein [Caudoviricetes sp.]